MHTWCLLKLWIFQIVIKLINWKSGNDHLTKCVQLLENGSVHCGHSITYYTFFILRHTLYKCTLSWKIVPIIVVTINGEELHCTHHADQLALTCKVSPITSHGWFQTALPPHHTGKTRRFRNPYRATKVLRHGEIIIDFIKKYTSNTFMAPGLEVVTWGYGN